MILYKAHLVLTWALIGAVWFVLIVHYPAFRLINKESFEKFEKFHVHRTLGLAIPIMILEVVTALLLIKLGPVFILNAFLIFLIWLLTFTGCFPMHKKLEGGFSNKIYKNLISIHSARVFLWSLRGVLLFLVKFPS